MIFSQWGAYLVHFLFGIVCIFWSLGRMGWAVFRRFAFHKTILMRKGLTKNELGHRRAEALGWTS